MGTDMPRVKRHRKPELTRCHKRTWGIYEDSLKWETGWSVKITAKKWYIIM